MYLVAQRKGIVIYMASNREKIEDVLYKGQAILSSRPELADMDLHDIINDLDDGTPEMLHNRWGVAAWVFVKSINDFTMQSLVESLSNVESGLLTYVYTGYLLLTRYGVNLEELLLCADKCDKFEKIVPFVSENLIYETELYEKSILPIMCMMEKHLEHSSYHPFLRKYSEHITSFKAQKLVEERIGDINEQVKYDLMNYLCAGWYADNLEEASNYIERLLNRKGLLNKKLAIKFLDVSLHYNKSIFQKHFGQLEDMALAENQLWLTMIPLFVKYVVNENNNTEHDPDNIQPRVFTYLEKIPERTLDEKYEFLDCIVYQESISERLELIIKAILGQSFCKEQRFLNILDHYLYTYLQKNEWIYVLKLMRKVFIVNHYSVDYKNFFHALNLVAEKIVNYSAEITCQALKDVLSRDIGCLFFGLGLLLECGNIHALIKKEDTTNSILPPTLTNTQMIQVAKTILYFSPDTQKACHIAFQLLELSNDSNEQYIEFCLEEIFENYPSTMYKVAEQYIAATEGSQVALAQKIKHAYEQQLAAKKRCYEIKDLRPSREHDYIYRKALAEKNRIMRKQIREESFLASLFSSRFLKYGARNAHIMIGRKGEMIFQVSPYAHIQHEVELPTLYMHDPVDFALKKQAYLKEVTDDASSYKRLSASIERER